jgi:D-alanyl-D-alanine carboxypeptidase
MSRSLMGFCLLLCLIGAGYTTPNAPPGEGSLKLEARIQEIMQRPEYRNAHWGMKFYSPDTEQVIYSINSDQLFQPASGRQGLRRGNRLLCARTRLSVSYAGLPHRPSGRRCPEG